MKAFLKSAGLPKEVFFALFGILLLLGLLLIIYTSANNRVSVEGTLEVLHEDYFPEQFSKDEHFIIENNGARVPVFFLDGSHPGLLSGSKVRAVGVRARGGIEVGSARGMDFAVLQRAEVKNSPRTAVVVMFNFENDTSEPYTPSRVKDVVFNNDGVFYSSNNYYDEVSFGERSVIGKSDLTGDVYGWVTVDYDNSGCQLSSWIGSARDKIIADGNDLTGYDHYLYVFPNASSCGWTAKGNLGGQETYYNGNFSAFYPTHELGHNFGVRHASGLWDCTDSAGNLVPFSENCKVLEHGDIFDVMGTASHYHYNNYHKSRLGWFSSGDIQTVNSTGEYDIYPIEQVSDGIQVLRVLRDSSPASYGGKYFPTSYFYLEYRQPFGFDDFDPDGDTPQKRNGSTGVMIRLGADLDYLQNTMLIDSNPNSGSVTNFSFADAPFRVGTSFNDPVKGITVEILELTSVKARVMITIDPDTERPTTPTNLSAAATNNSVTLSWSVSTDNRAVQGYKIYLIEGKGRNQRKTLIGNVAETSFTHTGLSGGTTYSYEVLAFDGAGNESDPASVTTKTTGSGRGGGKKR